VTRAANQPFQVADGLRLLLEAYRAHGGPEVTPEQVHLQELCLIAGWVQDAIELRTAEGGGYGPEHYLGQMRSLLRRLQG
jgi:hypothetical protein